MKLSLGSNDEPFPEEGNVTFCKDLQMHIVLGNQAIRMAIQYRPRLRFCRHQAQNRHEKLNLNEVAYLGPRTDILHAVEQAVAMWFISDPSPSRTYGMFDQLGASN